MRACALRRTRGESGLSLVEVVFALAILGVAAMVLAAAISGSLRATSFARERSVALAAAETQMESILGLGGASIADLIAYDGTLFAVADLCPVGAALNPGEVRIDVTEVPLVVVEVTVRWLGSGGPEQIRLRSGMIVDPLGGP